MTRSQVEAMWANPNMTPTERNEAWEALDPELREQLRATVRCEQEWGTLPGKIRVVQPKGADTSRLDRIRTSDKSTKAARVLTIRCQSGHRLAQIFRDGHESVYVADADSPARGWVLSNAEGMHVGATAPERVTTGRDELVVYIDRMIADLPPEAVTAGPMLSARCRCEGSKGRVSIPVLWMARMMAGDGRWVTWPPRDGSASLA